MPQPHPTPTIAFAPHGKRGTGRGETTPPEFPLQDSIRPDIEDENGGETAIGWPPGGFTWVEGCEWVMAIHKGAGERMRAGAGY
eukprot:CAMPEP_0206325736 /NCGR_PEP_ID=MMETSP0106_2-20121207/21236_1 /ASSEMBLY_ACC=CAM_ASM_000206 /TAXON_ID=81532 /ORGANISM="Acanthoeca-like sp., Strain 10tr" /LENGTH=83 /DNA_ID=CAMNT_0053758231 /DNA_START=127 /DNA_END=375 /DNA_ORIENTATION=-